MPFIETLESWRLRAAAASGGTSIDALYDRAAAWVRTLSRESRLLDYGAGSGTLLRRLLAGESPAKMIGADLLPRPVELSPEVAWLEQDLNRPLALSAESLEAIVAIEVIEHLENPRAVARDWFRLLKPGGRLFATTPNTESWRSILTLVVKGHHQEFTDENYPAHITALVGTDLRRVLTEAGFTDLRFGYVLTSRLVGRLTWTSLLPWLRPGRRTGKHVVVTAVKPA